eukprot:7573823-Karenia_brevis.AAC.1
MGTNQKSGFDKLERLILASRGGGSAPASRGGSPAPAAVTPSVGTAPGMAKGKADGNDDNLDDASDFQITATAHNQFMAAFNLKETALSLSVKPGENDLVPFKKWWGYHVQGSIIVCLEALACQGCRHW